MATEAERFLQVEAEESEDKQSEAREFLGLPLGGSESKEKEGFSLSDVVSQKFKLPAVKAVAEAGKELSEKIESGQEVVRDIGEKIPGLGPTLSGPLAVSEAVQFMIPKSSFEIFALALSKPIGAATGAVVKGISSKFGKAVGGVKFLIDLAKKRNIPLSPADITKSKRLATLENLIEKTPLGSGEIEVFRKSQIKALGEFKDRILSRLGSEESKIAAGVEFKEAVKQQSRKKFSEAGELFNKVEEFAGNTKIEMPNLEKAAKKLLEQQNKFKPSDRNNEIVKLAQENIRKEFPTPTVSKFEAANLGLTGRVPPTKPKQDPFSLNFTERAGKRIKLNEIIVGEDAAIALGQKGLKGQSSALGGAAKFLKKAMQSDFDAFAKTSGGEIERANKLANAFFGGSKDRFANKTIKTLTRTNPEDVSRFIFRPNNITEIRHAKKAAGKEGFDKLRRTFLSDLMDTIPEDKFSPQALDRQLKKFGNETLKEIFSPDELIDLKELATLSKSALTAESLPGTFGSARTLVSVSSVAGAGGLIIHNPAVGVLLAPGIFIGPKLIAKLYLSPAGRKLLITGFKLPRNAPAAAKISAQLATVLGSKIPDQGERESE